ncbi:hypothetical protein GEU84_002500 [Fertoebacter nigrum]|uniref:Uncharacterized protein n=1 Tax=Fertoeibacter niger TaxID=2656921 RepID=A0A8X8GXY8_9RHOB|nr:hypothetical protein [Fertoeibacter niger]NUB43240.1 hypothetical protein [Fertoeibacter niger]
MKHTRALCPAIAAFAFLAMPAFAQAAPAEDVYLSVTMTAYVSADADPTAFQAVSMPSPGQISISTAASQSDAVITPEQSALLGNAVQAMVDRITLTPGPGVEGQLPLPYLVVEWGVSNDTSSNGGGFSFLPADVPPEITALQQAMFADDLLP